jgi:hypothetical protein
MFAIRCALCKWCGYLVGEKFEVVSDSVACRWFFSQPTPSPKALRWMHYLAQFSFVIRHRPSKEKVVADALSCPNSMSVSPVVIENR